MLHCGPWSYVSGLATTTHLYCASFSEHLKLKLKSFFCSSNLNPYSSDDALIEGFPRHMKTLPKEPDQCKDSFCHSQIFCGEAV